MAKVRIAQIGIVQPHAAGYRETLLHMPEIEIVAAYDPTLPAATARAETYGLACPFYDDVAELLARERPEAVLICLPPVDTPGVIQLATAAGCHIYAEKPCARTAAEFLPAMAAIDAAGVHFATGYMRHFSPVARAIKGFVDQGLLGRLVSAEARLITTSVASRDPGHWMFRREQAGGGIFHWLGCHWLDLFRWTTGSEVATVGAIMATGSGAAIDVEDVGTLALRYDNGMVAAVHCAYVADPGSGADANQWYVGFRGTLGWVQWGPAEPEIRVRSTHPDWQTAPTRTLRFDADPAPGYGGATGVFALRQFIAGFRGQAAPPFTPLDALRILETLDAAGESSRTGRHVAPARHG
jgi:predicted dehydrogenase